MTSTADREERTRRDEPGDGREVYAVAGPTAVAPEVGRVLPETGRVWALRTEIHHETVLRVEGDLPVEPGRGRPSAAAHRVRSV